METQKIRFDAKNEMRQIRKNGDFLFHKNAQKKLKASTVFSFINVLVLAIYRGGQQIQEDNYGGSKRPQSIISFSFFKLPISI